MDVKRRDVLLGSAGTAAALAVARLATPKPAQAQQAIH